MISPCKIIDIFFSCKQKLTFCLILYAFFTFNGYSQAIRADYQAYIEQYRSTALQHQQVFGIPASITLAQGLLESRAGKSGLAINGNNHFGIKDFNWKGEVLCYGDSTNMSCYRKYGAPEDSFLDHARFLKSKRYGRLYELDITDYRAWAEGLRECGYAEDPAYPQKLIGIIEQYRLHELDASLASTVTTATATADLENHAESKAAKQARERAEKRALKQAQKEAREKEKLAKQQEKKAREQEKKAHEQQLKEQRALERLAHEQQERAKREQQRRERAERYAQRHSSDSNDNISPQSSTRRTAQNATRSNGNTIARGYASADND